MSRVAFILTRCATVFVSLFILATVHAVDSFTPTAHAMNAARTAQLATLLPSGSVFVSGGLNATPSAVNSAETYDPVADTWTLSTHTMNATRYAHVAVLLPSGKILLAGGYDTTNLSINSAEIYDPAADTFTASAHTLVTPRGEFPAVLLPNGKVLLTGGFDGSNLPSISAELYDPSTDTFTATPKGMLVARAGHSATLLQTGKVLIAGGTAFNGSPTSAVELFDPATNTFKFTAKGLTVARTQHTATLLSNGMVLVCGGVDLSGFANARAELYDPVTDKWTFTTTLMVEPRVFHRASLLPSGEVLVTGGQTNASVADASAEIYDPVANTWIATTQPMNTTRKFHSSTVLGNGTVLIAGGTGAGALVTNTSELYTLNAPVTDLALTSGPAANPSTAAVGATIAFSAVASGGSGTLTYSWDFGDGSVAVGPSVNHVYVTPGTFTATISVTDTKGGVATGSTVVAVTDATVLPLALTAHTIKLNFLKANVDTITFGGTLAIPAGFVTGGAPVQINIGNIAISLILTAQGTGTLNGNAFAVALKKKNGVVIAQNARFAAALKNGSFKTALGSVGLVNATEANTPVNVPFSIALDNLLFQKVQTMKYTAKAGKTGSAK